jgi:tetratricopeptide (TPR) repeat protein
MASHWKSSIVTVVALFVFAFGYRLVTPARAQPDEDLRTVYREMKELRSTDRNSDALPLATYYREQTRLRYGEESPEHAKALAELAELYYELSRYTEAEPLYKQALAIRERTLGPQHAAVGDSLSNLAGLYRTQGRYEVSERIYKNAIAVQEAALGGDHKDLGATLNNFGALYRLWGRYDEAEPLIKQVRIPAHVGHPFRRIPATCSDGSRPPVPIEAGHP